MAHDNIDNLNFKVILDDANFDAQITRDIELAKKLNVQLSALLNVKSQVANTKMVGDATKAAKLYPGHPVATLLPQANLKHGDQPTKQPKA